MQLQVGNGKVEKSRSLKTEQRGWKQPDGGYGRKSGEGQEKSRRGKGGFEMERRLWLVSLKI